MDNGEHVLEMQRGLGDGDDFRVGTEQPSVLTEDDLYLLQLHDQEEVREIITRYAEMDIPRENVELFKQHLLQRVDSFFVAVADVGLIYLTNIVPTFTANLQVIFWDKKFGKVRRGLVQRVLATAFEEFSLTRAQAFVSETNVQLSTVELRKIGFVQEGVLRNAWREREDCNLVVFGLLQTEVKWQIVNHLMTSLAPRT